MQAIPLPMIDVIGKKLFGDHWWQASFARALGISKAQLTRILKGVDDGAMISDQPGRNIPINFEASIHTVIVTRIADLTTLLSTPGLPKAGTPELAEAAGMIQAALKLVA